MRRKAVAKKIENKLLDKLIGDYNLNVFQCDLEVSQALLLACFVKCFIVL